MGSRVAAYCVRLLALLATVSAFLTSTTTDRGGNAFTLGTNKGGRKSDDSPTSDLLGKFSWFAVETFGKTFGKPEAKGREPQSRQPLTFDETLQRLQQDNEKAYFLSGEIDSLIYDDQCTFADPFVSFQGRDRFVENLANLGSFITNYSVRELDYSVVPSEYTVKTKFMVKLELNLPWKPILAWPWGVTCVVNPETNLIELHEESWDIPPMEGVQQIFRRPTTKIS